jgi:hypothetical protein
MTSDIHCTSRGVRTVQKETQGAMYLLLDVIEGIRRVDCEADEDDVGVWVAEGSEPIIVFLARRIP